MLGRLARDVHFQEHRAARRPIVPAAVDPSRRSVAGCRPNGSCPPAAASARTLFRCKWPIMCQRIGKSGQGRPRAPKAVAGGFRPIRGSRPRPAAGSRRPDVLGDRQQADRGGGPAGEGSGRGNRGRARGRGSRRFGRQNQAWKFSRCNQERRGRSIPRLVLLSCYSSSTVTTAREALATRMHEGCCRASRATRRRRQAGSCPSPRPRRNRAG